MSAAGLGRGPPTPHRGPGPAKTSQNKDGRHAALQVSGVIAPPPPPDKFLDPLEQGGNISDTKVML